MIVDNRSDLKRWSKLILIACVVILACNFSMAEETEGLMDPFTFEEITATSTSDGSDSGDEFFIEMETVSLSFSRPWIRIPYRPSIRSPFRPTF